MFVVIITENEESAFAAAPRAVGPFEDFDAAQAFSLTLIEKWEAEGAAPLASVVRVEEAHPGVVVGEI